MNKVIHFEGTITTVQPYASSTPSMVKNVKSGQPLPVTRDFINGEPVLSIKASSIRGGLRRAAADIALLYQKEKTGEDKPFTLTEHKLNRFGGSKGKGDSDRVSPEDFQRIREEHLLVALFGSGNPFIAGQLNIESAKSNHNAAEVIDGVRADDFQRTPTLMDLLSEADLQQYLAENSDIATASALKKKRTQTLRQFMQADTEAQKSKFDKELKQIDADLAKIKVVSTQMPLSGYERIPANEHLSHIMRIRLKGEQDNAVLGFFIESLKYFAFNPVLGAHANQGCGEISMQYTVYSSAYNEPKTEVGKITMTPYQEIQLEGDFLLDAVATYAKHAKEHKFDFKEV